MAIMGKHIIFRIFFQPWKKNLLTSAKIGCHFEFFFGQTNDNELVSMCPKFEVISYCGWDFNQGGGKFTPPPCFNATLDTPCTIGLKTILVHQIMSHKEEDLAQLLTKSKPNPKKIRIMSGNKRYSCKRV